MAPQFRASTFMVFICLARSVLLGLAQQDFCSTPDYVTVSEEEQQTGPCRLYLCSGLQQVKITCVRNHSNGNAIRQVLDGYALRQTSSGDANLFLELQGSGAVRSINCSLIGQDASRLLHKLKITTTTLSQIDTPADGIPGIPGIPGVWADMRELKMLDIEITQRGSGLTAHMFDGLRSLLQLKLDINSAVSSLSFSVFEGPPGGAPPVYLRCLELIATNLICGCQENNFKRSSRFWLLTANFFNPLVEDEEIGSCGSYARSKCGSPSTMVGDFSALWMSSFLCPTVAPDTVPPSKQEVQCDSSGLEITVAGSGRTRVQLGDRAEPSCQGVFRAGKVIIKTGLDSCGNILELSLDKKHLYVTNFVALESGAPTAAPQPGVTPITGGKFKVNCTITYRGASEVAFLPPGIKPMSAALFEERLFLSMEVPNPPDMFGGYFFNVILDVEDPTNRGTYKFDVRNCWSSGSADSLVTDVGVKVIIKNGCVFDGTLTQDYQSNSQSFRAMFSVGSFELTSDPESYYMHCDVEPCNTEKASCRGQHLPLCPGVVSPVSSPATSAGPQGTRTTDLTSEKPGDKLGLKNAAAGSPVRPIRVKMRPGKLKMV